MTTQRDVMRALRLKDRCDCDEPSPECDGAAFLGCGQCFGYLGECHGCERCEPDDSVELDYFGKP